MNSETWERLARCQLTLDQTSKPLEFDREEVEQFYIPIALYILGQKPKGKRLIIAVAGPPGSGKTAFSTLLAALINAETGTEKCVFIGMDGWHYPNSYLDDHKIQRGGEIIPLRQIKGAPETFDAQMLSTCLHKIRLGELIHYPIYSRNLHDPIIDAGCVYPIHQIAIVEGNYLLLNEEPWKHIQNLSDVRLFIIANPKILEDGLRQRHLRGGKASEDIEKHMAQVDLPNIERVLQNSIDSDVLIYKKDSLKIERLEICDLTSKTGSPANFVKTGVLYDV